MVNSIKDIEKYGKVGLLMGGWSAEREVSINSGRAVLKALENSGVAVTAIDVSKNIITELSQHSFDRIFNIMHGRGGEDGTVQAILDVMNIPYTGSGVLGSALAMDKFRSKCVWQSANLPTPEYVLLESKTDCELALQELGLPLIIKPIYEGSSIGISKAETEDEVYKAWDTAKQYGVSIAERWIEGDEYTVSILGDDVLPMIRLETPKNFYDYEAKYLSDDTQYHCPCGLDADLEKQCARLAKEAFRLVGASGWGRVDFMMDDYDQPWLIEINTVPGMTDHSLVPMAAKQMGINFDELVLKILDTSF